MREREREREREKAYHPFQNPSPLDLVSTGGGGFREYPEPSFVG